jgi:hypothetical protein
VVLRQERQLLVMGQVVVVVLVVLVEMEVVRLVEVLVV